MNLYKVILITIFTIVSLQGMNDDYSDDLFVQQKVFSEIFSKYGWIEEGAMIPMINETEKKDVGYIGNAKSTNLYGNKQYNIFPTLPWIATYNPEVSYGTIQYAFKFSANENLKNYFSEKVKDCSLVIQYPNFELGKEPALKLHGLIHGEDADKKNANTQEHAIVHMFNDGSFNKKLSLQGAVYVHGGVASPDNFHIGKFNLDEPQAFKVTTKTHGSLICTFPDSLYMRLSNSFNEKYLNFLESSMSSFSLPVDIEKESISDKKKNDVTVNLEKSESKKPKLLGINVIKSSRRLR